MRKEGEAKKRRMKKEKRDDERERT